MLTYERLIQDKALVPGMIGMTLAAFDELYGAFEGLHQRRLKECVVTKRTGTVRRRVTGAGARHRYDLRDRLLMTLFWQHVYTTYAVIGFFYDIDATNVEDNMKGVLATLATMAPFSVADAAAERPKLRSPQAVVAAFPAVRLLEARAHSAAALKQQERLSHIGAITNAPPEVGRSRTS